MPSLKLKNLFKMFLLSAYPTFLCNLVLHVRYVLYNYYNFVKFCEFADNYFVITDN